MTDCDHPRCHEQMMSDLQNRPTWDDFNPLKDAVGTKMPKTWVWLGFIFIGLPLVGIGAGMWASQTASNFRFAQKDSIVACQVRIERLEESGRYMRRDLDEIKKNIHEILKIMRAENGH